MKMDGWARCQRNIANDTAVHNVGTPAKDANQLQESACGAKIQFVIPAEIHKWPTPIDRELFASLCSSFNDSDFKQVTSKHGSGSRWRDYASLERVGCCW
jgi:hypothetical protein